VLGVTVNMPGVGRAVEPADGEIAVTLGAAGGGGIGSDGVGPDGDLVSHAENPIANANSNTLRQVLFVMAFSLPIMKRESAVKARRGCVQVSAAFSRFQGRGKSS
jgi:hypothetical protein